MNTLRTVSTLALCASLLGACGGNQNAEAADARDARTGSDDRSGRASTSGSEALTILVSHILLAAAMVIAQTYFVAENGADDLILLVDDPAAELDQDNRQRLFALLQDIPAQMFIAALEPDDLPWLDNGNLFHVEHGKLSSRP